MKRIGAQKSMGIPSSGIKGNLVTLMITQQIEQGRNPIRKQQRTHVGGEMPTRALMCMNVQHVNDYAHGQKHVILTAQFGSTRRDRTTRGAD